MSTLRRIYCITENLWVSEWSDVALTACPNDSEHTINEDSDQMVITESSMFSFIINKTFTSSVYVRVGRFHYDPNTIELRRLVFVGSKNGAVTNFTIQVYDATNNAELLAYTSSNADENAVVDAGLFSNVPTSEAMLETRIKQTGGTVANDYVQLDTLMFNGYVVT